MAKEAPFPNEVRLTDGHEIMVVLVVLFQSIMVSFDFYVTLWSLFNYVLCMVKHHYITVLISTVLVFYGTEFEFFCRMEKIVATIFVES